ncbi:MAG: hypothetical protein M3Y18_06430 [Candidatus Eremiobacteraeota bacterium]|nr:hypothetical protein [Candidatus Eremiobacteraeota bacterium]
MYDLTDDRGVPQSRGIPKVVTIAAVLGILAIFAIGGFVIEQSYYGHGWPADKTLRLPLSGSGGR